MMAYKDHSDFDFQPLNLSKQEMEFPKNVISEFYSLYSDPCWETILTEWSSVAFSKEQWAFGSPASLLRFHNELIRLLEASWLIKGSNALGHNLLEKSIQELFQCTSLPVYRDDLWDMLNAGLSGFSVKETGDYKSCTKSFVCIYTFLHLIDPITNGKNFNK